jgi:modification methylase
MSDCLPINQVLQGDCIELMNALPPRCVDLVFADPPYNLQLNGELWRPNMTKVDAADDDWDQFSSFEEYDAFTQSWLTAARRILKDTGTIWVIGSYHNIYRVGKIMMDLGYWILNDVVWIKSNPTPQMKGVRFCNAHETLLWAKKSKEQAKYTFHYRAMKAGNEDRQMRSDWYIPICSGRERLTVNGAKAHTTQKPEALLRRVILSTSNPGDLIFDPFCGTGTTAAVAKQLGRRYLTVDLDATYVRVACERIANTQPSMVFPDNCDWVDAPRSRIPFLYFVESGQLPAGETLWLKGSEITATVQADGSIVANGVRGSIHKVGARCLNLPACNGWTHWHYRDPETGALRPLDDLRGKSNGSEPAPDREE